MIQGFTWKLGAVAPQRLLVADPKLKVDCMETEVRR